MHKIIYALVLGVFFGGTSLAGAQSVPESNTLSSGNLGSISFFLNRKKPATQGESIHVIENSVGRFCLQLNAQVPDLATAVSHLTQVEMILQGEGDHPQIIKAKTKLKNTLLYSNALNCYVGRFEIPMGIPAGKYRVAELDLTLASRHTLSFRDKLSQFSPMGLVEVSSPIKDLTSPMVEKIESWVPLENTMNMRYSRAWAKVSFRVTAVDQDVGIDPDSFQILFKVFLDDERVDILKAQCSTILPNLHYNCKLYFSRAIPDFRGRTLKLVLDSLTVADKLGNMTELTTPQQLEKIFAGKLMQYIFYTGKIPGKNGKPETNSKDEDERDEHIENSSKPKSIFINNRRDRI